MAIGGPPPVAIYYLILIAAVFAMSTGGVLFGLMIDTPLFMRVSWRLSVASALQAVGFVWDWRRSDAALRARWLQCVPMQALNGVILAVHFYSFASSIEHTSYTNSMLIVSVVPMVFVLWGLGAWALGAGLRWVLWRGVGSPGDARPQHEEAGAGLQRGDDEGPVAAAANKDTAAASTAHPLTLYAARALASLAGSSRDPRAPLPPTLLEVVGACVALGGVAALVLQTERERAASPVSRLIRAPSLRGDLAAGLSALCMAVYLTIGRSQRAWMPLWMYACPVTLVAACVAAAASLALEPGTSMGMAGDAALLGWLASPRSAGLALAAGIIPTIMGHSMTNLALGHVHPLLVSVVQLMQPIIGSVYAYALGVSGPPSPVVAWAGPVILGGILMVVTGSRGSPCPLPTLCKQRGATRTALADAVEGSPQSAEPPTLKNGAAPMAPRADSAWHALAYASTGGVVWVT